MQSAAKAAGRNLSDSGNAANYAPKVIAKTPQAKGFRRHELATAMERLFADGRIRIDEYGRPARPHRRLVAVDDITNTDEADAETESV